MSSEPAPHEVRILHPWLLALFPVLHFYSQNLGFVRDREVPVSILVVLALATVAFLVSRQLAWGRHAAGLATTVLLLAFFLYGHLALVAVERGARSPDLVLLPVAAVVSCGLLVVLWLARSSPVLRTATSALNVACAFLLVLPSFTIAAYWIADRGADLEADQAALPTRAPKVMDGPASPDVYYIILDGYSSNAHLQRAWGYDNSRFTNALQRLGFFVTADSRSNYGATLLSLGSSLNLDYLRANDSDIPDDRLYLRGLVADNEVARQLIERGYTYNYMLSGYLAPSRIADLNIDFRPAGVLEFGFRSSQDAQKLEEDAITDGRFYKQSFYEALSNTTLLRLVSRQLWPLFHGEDEPYTWHNPDRFFATLERLEAVPDDPHATFSFVHLLKPHGPVQLRRDGSRLPKRVFNPTPEQFFAELEFVNERVLATLEVLLEKSSTPPIIVVQADHGTDLGSVWTRGQPPRLTHFEILNAFFVPSGRPPDLSSDITPVNSFRVLLNAYFGTDYELLPSRHYDIPEGYKDPFRHVDVTGEFRSPPRADPGAHPPESPDNEAG
jgi:hypothetical protein